MSEQRTSNQIFDTFEARLNQDLAPAGIGTVQFNLSGTRGGKWWIRIGDGAATAGRGNTPDLAAATVLVPAEDFIAACVAPAEEAARRFGSFSIKGDAAFAQQVHRLLNDAFS
jgi:hypothetical protein